MSKEEFAKVMASKTLSVDEPGAIFTATNPAYLLDKRSFIHKDSQQENYDVIVQIELRKGTLSKIEADAIPEAGGTKRARTEHIPIRKIEGSGYASSVNYGFYTNLTIKKYITGRVIDIKPIWKR